MNIDKNALNALLSMSDAEFSEKINAVTSRLGMNGTVNAARVKMMLGAMTENDLSNLLSSLGEEKAAEITRIIKGGK